MLLISVIIFAGCSNKSSSSKPSKSDIVNKASELYEKDPDSENEEIPVSLGSDIVSCLYSELYNNFTVENLELIMDAKDFDELDKLSENLSSEQEEAGNKATEVCKNKYEDEYNKYLE